MGAESTPFMKITASETETEIKKQLELLSTIGEVQVFRQNYVSGGEGMRLVVVYQNDPSSGFFGDALLDCDVTGLHASIEVDTQDCPSTADSLVAASADSAAGQVGEAYFAYLTGPEEVHAAADYLGDGLFEVSYTTPKVGDYNLTVAKTIRGGLLGSYFNNKHLYGEPAMSRVDSALDFQWAMDDSITDTGKDHISVRWTGLLLPAFSEQSCTSSP
jgi:hypothetical protein